LVGQALDSTGGSCPARSRCGQLRLHRGARRDNGHRQTYRIVGEDETDPARGTLSSYVSPVARALMGKQVDDTVPMGSSGAEILSIKCS